MRQARAKTTRGFGIVEMVVAIGLFTTLMLIIMGSFLSIMDAARKSRSTRVALDNVSAVLDYMAREIRLGVYFRCEDGNALAGTITTVRNCPYASGGGQYLAFNPAGSNLSSSADQLVFWVYNGTLYRSIASASGGNATGEALTAPELNITSFRFFVDGTTYSAVPPAPADQPRISILIRGVAGGNKAKTQTTFSVQTTLSARTPNITAP